MELHSLQVKYYGNEQFEVNRYKSAILDYQVCLCWHNHVRSNQSSDNKEPNPTKKPCGFIGLNPPQKPPNLI